MGCWHPLINRLNVSSWLFTVSDNPWHSPNAAGSSAVRPAALRTCLPARRWRQLSRCATGAAPKQGGGFGGGGGSGAKFYDSEIKDAREKQIKATDLLAKLLQVGGAQGAGALCGCPFACVAGTNPKLTPHRALGAGAQCQGSGAAAPELPYRGVLPHRQHLHADGELAGIS